MTESKNSSSESMSSNALSLYDVVIIGAGPGGSATATFLAQKGVKVLLLDRAMFPRNKICGDGLTPRAVTALERLGVLEQVTNVSQRINYAKVIAPNGKEIISSIGEADIAQGAYMLAIPRLKLDHILVENAVSSGVILIEGCKVNAIENNSDGVIVKGSIKRKVHEFHAKYAIIATGANMGLLKKQGFLANTPKPIIAARAYYEGANYDRDFFNFHFNEVILPGYGWVFPLADNKINVGIGVIPGKSKKQHDIKALYHDFTNRPYMKQVLSGAIALGEVQSYPIRTDFMTATLYRERTLAVGEAAGLTNPLTGEGIDYALECAEIAAQQLHEMLTTGDNPEQLSNYALALHHKFDAIFNFSNQMTTCCLKPFMLNTMVVMAAKRKNLRESLTNIVLGLKEPPANITVGKILLKIVKNLKN
jgi:geranylgeranyl reductase family protein